MKAGSFRNPDVRYLIPKAAAGLRVGKPVARPRHVARLNAGT